MAQGRRGRDQRDTGVALEQAAVALFASKGYDNTTVDEIARCAGVSPRTFFNYFPAKEDVLFAHGHDRARRLRDAVAAQPSDILSLHALREAFGSMSEDFLSNRDAILIQARAIRSSPVLEGKLVGIRRDWEAAMASGLAARAGRDVTMADRVLAGVAMAVLDVAVAGWVDAGGDGDLLDLVADGFGAIGSSI